NDERSDDASHEARRTEVRGAGGAVVEKNACQEPSDEGSHDPEEGGGDPSHGVVAGHDRPGEQSSDQTHDEHRQDSHVQPPFSTAKCSDNICRRKGTLPGPNIRGGTRPGVRVRNTRMVARLVYTKTVRDVLLTMVTLQFMDALKLLTQDHRNVERLFKAYEQTGEGAAKQKERLAGQIIRELSIHATIEEQFLYPTPREY